MTRDEMIREMNNRRGSWQAIVIVYGLIVATMAGSAMLIL